MKENEFLSEADLSKDTMRIIKTDDGFELRFKFHQDRKEKAFFLSKKDAIRIKKLLASK